MPKSNGHKVEVSFENRACTIFVLNGESVLSALERHGLKEQLSVPSIPQDCRRGCCLTCTARHVKDSQRESIVKSSDGLVDDISRSIDEEGYVLTCSSYVIGSGLKLELFQNEDSWRFMHTGVKKDISKLGMEVS